MKIVYHSADNDGRASAAIIYREFGVMQMMQESDFIGFDYNKGVTFPEVKEGEVWYFVDVSLGWESFAQIKKCIEGGAKVYHIDHHRNGEFMEQNMSPEDLNIMDQVVKFYDIHESATMLCWVYTHMTPEQREDPMAVTYDFSEGYTHFMFTDSPAGAEYSIPIGFRYVNDQDMYHREFAATGAFTAGMIELDSPDKFHEGSYERAYNGIGPMSKVWVEIFNSNKKFLSHVIELGDRRIVELEMIYVDLRKTAKAVIMELDGVKYDIICIETEYHGSKVAGELFTEYDAYCRYNFDEKDNVWRYTFYSREDGKYLPCHLMCRHLDPNGGGHLHAAGCATDILKLPIGV